MLIVTSCFSPSFLVLKIVFHLEKVEYPLTDENYIKCIKRLPYYLTVLKHLYYSLLSLDIYCLLSRYFYFSGIFPLSFILNSHLFLNLAFFADFLKLLRNAGNTEMRSDTGVLRSPDTQRDTK